ncbi:hypothetical protein ACTOB_004616 [Actinoplanes oblitus]|uniref:Uncharacterized protein n=1 Tax=Actinoplanes oblitus TaxID=3040509 RepID=A0ABY8W4N5_9ACTN|nr:hypothetical protein [Actinoplanes oblitus]WIM92663.1 hypothetical protein ACTOB_004616 [Actinoplanes oblitus]
MGPERTNQVGEHTATLLKLSLQLRAAAADADRQDVIEHVDALMRLIAGDHILAADGPAKSTGGTAETIHRILNGLGL